MFQTLGYKGAHIHINAVGNLESVQIQIGNKIRDVKSVQAGKWLITHSIFKLTP